MRHHYSVIFTRAQAQFPHIILKVSHRASTPFTLLLPSKDKYGVVLLAILGRMSQSAQPQADFLMCFRRGQCVHFQGGRLWLGNRRAHHVSELNHLLFVVNAKTAQVDGLFLVDLDHLSG